MLGMQGLRAGKQAQREDAFWHAAFSHEPYYAPGRSYDQYRPAYALGWQAAFHHAATDFSGVEEVLEQRWESCDTGSLLAWGQVRGAAEAAWLRGQACQQRGRATGDAVRVARQVCDLRLQLLQASGDLQLLLPQTDPPPAAFVYQVVERHADMLAQLGLALPAPLPWDWGAPLRHLALRLHQGRMRLRLWWSDTDTDLLLQQCDMLEVQLLAAYQGLQTQTLMPELLQLLQRQTHQLQLHHDKLQWVRQHWRHCSAP
ncbi:hypothetical protein [Comamonas sp. GB3 AK4-5]|uniref:hypothetical protein n=1 Tax=Comamonas sp. GB3 AK4-5 TaxID=3231487 RepID=UPI00351DCCD2